MDLKEIVDDMCSMKRMVKHFNAADFDLYKKRIENFVPQEQQAWALRQLQELMEG